mgnify:CR=1 FL=1
MKKRLRATYSVVFREETVSSRNEAPKAERSESFGVYTASNTTASLNTITHSLTEQFPGDDVLLDLARPLVDGRHLRITIEALDIELGGVAVPTV